MYAVLLDFNGTMFFDSSLHQEAWSKIYRELHPEDTGSLDTAIFCGPCNNAILENLAPWLTKQQRDQYSEHKEELYRRACLSQPEKPQLVAGVEDCLQTLQALHIPFALASASIKSNIDFYFETFGLDRWFDKDQVVYDDGTYPDKGAMHLEAARRLGVPLSECILIEDSPTAIRFAKRNGAGCIVAVGNTAAPEVLTDLGADHYIRDFTQFDTAWLTF